MAYPETDVIILCYSVVRPDSMENILTKWILELNKFIPGVLIILVGTQVDLRDSSNINSNEPSRPRHISTREGEELKEKIKAVKFIECSAITQLNIKEIFDSCVQVYANSNKKVQPSCFQSLFRRFASSIRRRLTFRRNSTNSTKSSVKSSAKSSSKNSRKYLHES
jgi:GTPase SAR1 family protein